MENGLLDNATQEMEYIGDIPEGWKWVKLGEMAEIKTGKTNSQDADNTGDYLLFDRSSVIKRSKKFLFDTEAVIVPGEGKEFIPRYYNGKFDLHQRTYAIFNFKKSIPKFIYYNVLLNKDIFKYFATGSTVLSLRLEHFLSFPILLPPIEEQKAIADVLSSIDDKIELLHRQNKTLEEMAMTLFRQWFIEPTKDGLPEGWEERKLKDIYIFEKGIEPGSKNYLETPSNDAVRFIRVGDMLDNKANVYIKKDLAGNSICKFDDLLVSFDGTVGRVSFGLVGCYSSGIRKVHSKDEVYNKLWLKHQIFISEEIQDEINMHAEGTTILHASSSIDYLSFVFPPKEKIEEYDKFFDPIYKKILNNKTQIQTLEKLRDTLLPKLMSGEVKII